jgi:hypothetical protein
LAHSMTLVVGWSQVSGRYIHDLTPKPRREHNDEDINPIPMARKPKSAHIYHHKSSREKPSWERKEIRHKRV